MAVKAIEDSLKALKLEKRHHEEQLEKINFAIDALAKFTGGSSKVVIYSDKEVICKNKISIGKDGTVIKDNVNGIVCGRHFTAKRKTASHCAVCVLLSRNQIKKATLKLKELGLPPGYDGRKDVITKPITLLAGDAVRK